MMIKPDKLARFIDQTILKPEATIKEIDDFIEGFTKYDFYCACVNSCWIEHLKENLPTGTRICSVVGFPLGAASTDIKALEAGELVRLGCDEIDMVMNIGRLKSRDYKYIEGELKAVLVAAAGKILKVIIETCLLTEEEKVTSAEIVKNSGAHFVKTSTGFSRSGANVEDVRILREAVGPDFGIKASGGIRDHKTTIELIDAGATRIGTSAGLKIMEEALRESAAKYRQF